MFCATGASVRAAHFSTLRRAFRESCQIVFARARNLKEMTESACRHDLGNVSVWKCKGAFRSGAHEICDGRCESAFVW
jgi:hypothetical protein